MSQRTALAKKISPVEQARNNFVSRNIYNRSHRHQYHNRRQKQQKRRTQPQCAPNVKVSQADPARIRSFSQQQAGNEETAQYEKQKDTQVFKHDSQPLQDAVTNSVVKPMSDDDHHHGKAAKSVQLRKMPETEYSRSGSLGRRLHRRGCGLSWSQSTLRSPRCFPSRVPGHRCAL